MQRLRFMVWKEFIQIRRDPRIGRLLIIGPLLQLFLFGYALRLDIQRVPIGVLDEDRSKASRTLIAGFEASPSFEVHPVGRPEELEKGLERGTLLVGLHLPRGFQREQEREGSPRLQFLVDGTDSNTAHLVIGYVNGVMQRYIQAEARRRLEEARLRGALVPSLEPHLRVWYNPDLKSVNFLVPGVICMLLMMITIVMTAFAIVKEREVGTLELLVMTPVRKGELLLGKTLPFVLISFLDVLFIVFAAQAVFHVPLRGSLALLLILTFPFLMTGLGLGLFVSTVSRTQQQALMLSVFLIIPSILLSGFIFPIENMPWLLRQITYLIPLRYFLVIVRGIFLKGLGLVPLLPQVLALLLLGGVIFTLSLLRFRKQL